MTHKQFEQFILSLPGVWLDYPFGEGTAVYKFGKENDGAGKMLALVQENSKPLRAGLKCDPLLAQNLREKYETVLAGYHLNKETLEYNHLLRAIDGRRDFRLGAAEL